MSFLIKALYMTQNFIFLHSYYFSACNQSLVSGETEYGLKFDAAISSDNIHGIQCHPEKSHEWGESC